MLYYTNKVQFRNRDMSEHYIHASETMGKILKDKTLTLFQYTVCHSPQSYDTFVYVFSLQYV